MHLPVPSKDSGKSDVPAGSVGTPRISQETKSCSARRSGGARAEGKNQSPIDEMDDHRLHHRDPFVVSKRHEVRVLVIDYVTENERLAQQAHGPCFASKSRTDPQGLNEFSNRK